MPAIGSATASAVLVEFSDYECPFCRRYATETMQELKRRIVDTGKVRYVFANFPSRSHPSARLLAKAAICAGQQNDYWHFHDRLFESYPKSVTEIVSLAAAIGIDETSIAGCLSKKGDAESRIEADIKAATQLGLISTPSFALGRPVDGDRVRVERLIIGAQQINVFESVISEMLETPG